MRPHYHFLQGTILKILPLNTVQLKPDTTYQSLA
jgi:hypothetical protein